MHVHMTNTRLTDPEILERRCRYNFFWPPFLFEYGIVLGCPNKDAFQCVCVVLLYVLFVCVCVCACVSVGDIDLG